MTAIIVVSAPACGYTTAPASPPSAVPPTIGSTDTSIANKATTLLSDGGFPLYVFQPDHRRRSTCSGSCAYVWPPVLVSPKQRAQAGRGVKASLLGTDPYSKNKAVVTYNGWPLYRYRDDLAPGSAAGEGTNLNGGYWYVISSDGVPIVPPGDPPAA
jgi:predicted lipoprotein with Yx(FWY)xxD motif